MRHIFQHYNSDCFPTCIAMIADISHATAIQMVHPFRFKRQSYETGDDRATLVLRRLGFKVRKRYHIDFTKLNQIAIVCIRVGVNHSHVVVWDPESKRVLDPSPHDRYTPISYYQDNFEWAMIVT